MRDVKRTAKDRLKIQWDHGRTTSMVPLSLLPLSFPCFGHQLFSTAESVGAFLLSNT